MILKNYLNLNDIEISENKINIILTESPNDYIALKNSFIQYFGSIQKIKTTFEKPKICNEFDESIDAEEWTVNVVEPTINEDYLFKTTNNLLYLNIEKVLQENSNDLIQEEGEKITEIFQKITNEIDNEIKFNEYEVNLKKMFSLLDISYFKKSKNNEISQLNIKKRQISLVGKYKKQILFLEYPETMITNDQFREFIKFVHELENTIIIVITNNIANIDYSEKLKLIVFKNNQKISENLHNEHKFLFKLSEEKYFNIVKFIKYDTILLNDIEQQVLSDLK